MYEMGSCDKCKQIKSCDLFQEWTRIKGQAYVLTYGPIQIFRSYVAANVTVLVAGKNVQS